MPQAPLREFAYRKVYRYIETLIEQSPPGQRQRLPSLRGLAVRLRVSLGTVQHAYNLLEEAGHVQRLPRSGYFVSDASPSDAAIAPWQPPLPGTSRLELSLHGHERRLARQRLRAAGASQDSGSVRLRQALAERYTHSSSRYWSAKDVHVAPDLTALFDTLWAALDLKHATVVVHSPCCWQLLQALARSGMPVLEVPLDAQGDLNLYALTCLLENEPVGLVVLPSCLSTPRGRLVSQACQQQLGHLLSRYPVWVLESDLDSELCHEGPPAIRQRDWVDVRQLLVVGGFEAALGPEAPYAYLLGPAGALNEGFAERAFRLPPLRMQALACMLDKGEVDAQWSWVRQALQRRTRTLARVLALRFGPQLQLRMPDGGGLLWARLRQPVPWEAVSKALAGSSLHAMPGRYFSLQSRFRHYLALGWTGDDPVELQAAVERLAQTAGHP
nr:aminotransferase class I/II-fold pyridoxal phosphate-dependent enzyme [uncultured Pseudomonas sp.]